MNDAAKSGWRPALRFVGMHALDAQFLWLEDAYSPMHIGSVCTFDGTPPTQAECEQLLAARLSSAPAYRMRLRLVPFGLGRPVWEDDPSFDVRNHLQRLTLEAPHDDAALCGLMGRLMSTPLDRDLPLWQMFVVERLAGGRWALITKVHHALVDGVAGMTLLVAMLDRQPNAPPSPPQPWAAAPTPDERTLVADALRGLREDAGVWGRALLGAIKRPRQALRRAAELGTGLSRYVQRLVPTQPFSLQGRIVAGRRYACARANLEELRQIRAAFHCTVNDVVLALLSGGYRALLECRGDDLTRVHLRSLVPVSARAPDAWGIFGNRVSAIVCELPVAAADPLERLRSISADMQRSKGSHMVHAGVWLTDVADLAPPFLMSSVSKLITRVLHRHPQRSIATVTTNVPGPSEPLYVLGRRMLEWLPYVPIAQGARIGCAVLSYAGQLSFGITADLQSLGDLEPFTRAIERDLHDLLARARAQLPAAEIQP